jgi:hypothetical protein
MNSIQDDEKHWQHNSKLNSMKIWMSTLCNGSYNYQQGQSTSVPSYHVGLPSGEIHQLT